MNHQRIKKFATSKVFSRMVNYMIVGFSLFIGIETIVKDPWWQHTLFLADHFFLTFFAIEIFLRIMAEDRPSQFFVLFRFKKITRDGKQKTIFEFSEHGFWNYFDFVLIAMSFVGAFAQMFLHPSFLQVGRLFRMFRIFRLLEISDHLKEVERRIMSIVPTVFTFITLLLVLLYIYAIMGMFMFESKVYATCNFSTVIDSFFTLFQVMTLDNWSDVMKDLAVNANGYPQIIIQLYFVSFVVFTAIIAFNVFVAVMTSQVQMKMEEEFEQKVAEVKNTGDVAREKIKATLEDVLAEVRIMRNELSELKKKP